jgi:mRNA interferase MazF
MTTYSRGDVILVDFVFSDERGSRKRPGVVVSSQEYHKGRREAIIAAITSQTGRLLTGDYLIGKWKEAGLLLPSVATGIIRTIKQDMISGKLGVMPSTEMSQIDGKLRAIFDL